MTNLIGLTQDQLYEVVRELGEAKFRGKQIYEWVYKHRAPSIDHMTNLPKDTREKLKEKYTIEHIKIEKILIDEKDETHKFLFSLNDQNTIEGVLMKYKYGYALCVSTQVGCKMGCTFCASTLEGIVRSLTSGEIIDQIMVVENHFQIRISNVVLMGSGEPLDNYDEVLKFIYNVNNSNGINIGQRHLSLSTCGIVPKIYDLAKENLQINLSISLHGSNDFIRSKMMPINKKYPLEQLIKACKFYIEKTGRRISFEYSMVNGVNDKIEHAKELEALLKGLNCHVNLIPVNEIKERDFIKSSKDNIIRFSRYLNDIGVPTTIRRELGSSINAACGQLRRNHTEKPKG